MQAGLNQAAALMQSITNSLLQTVLLKCYDWDDLSPGRALLLSFYQIISRYLVSIAIMSAEVLIGAAARFLDDPPASSLGRGSRWGLNLFR